MNWVASFRRVDGIELPPDGRSSVESIPGQLIPNAIGAVLAPFNLDVLRTLKKLWIENPDFSQHVRNIKSLGNTGHSLTIDAASDSIAEAALTRINESASRLYPNGAGVDGLINQYFDQVSVFGAVSSEDVVDFSAKRVDQVALVPVEQIRFRYVDGKFMPFQQPVNLLGFSRENALGGFLIPLNPETYKYYALQSVQNNPYALPPAVAAVDMLTGPQADVIANLAYVVKKFGIVGLVSVGLRPPPRKAGETEAEYIRRAEDYLAKVIKRLDGNFNKGLLVAYQDQKIEHSNIASDARGAAEIIQFIEELGFSGMGSMPFMHGRNYTTTETFADVIFNVILAQEENIQRLAKRRMESTYRLDLRLGGIQVDSITMLFNRPKTRDNWRTAQADQVKQTMIYERAKLGTISPDQAAQELGYEAAFDPQLVNGVQPAVAGGKGGNLWANRSSFSATFRFDQMSQRYRFIPSRVEIAESLVEAENLDNIVPMKKKQAA